MPTTTKAFRNFCTRLSTSFSAGIFGINAGTINTSDPNSIPAQFALRLVKIMGALVIPIAVVALIYSSFTLLTSAGNPDGMAKAKKNIGYLFMGIAFIVFARVLYNFVNNLFYTFR